MKHEKEPDISTLFGDALVGLIPAYDFLTDVFFVKLVYDTFQEQRKVLDQEHNDSEALSHKYSYLIALFVSLISTTAPIMFMLSCTIVIKFS